MTVLHKIEPKAEGDMYDFKKHCHLTYVFPLSNGMDPQGYVVIYDRIGSKYSVTFAEVVVTYNPYDDMDCVILGFGDYNNASSDADITDEHDMVRYNCLSYCTDDPSDAIREGEYLAELLSKSFMDAYNYFADLLDRLEKENE